jgi:hypothetical protein
VGENKNCNEDCIFPACELWYHLCWLVCLEERANLKLHGRIYKLLLKIIRKKYENDALENFTEISFLHRYRMNLSIV